MYAPKSKKIMKPNKPKMSVSKAKGNGKTIATTVHSAKRSCGQFSKTNAVFESQVSLGCSGNSSVNSIFYDFIESKFKFKPNDKYN